MCTGTLLWSFVQNILVISKTFSVPNVDDSKPSLRTVGVPSESDMGLR